MDEKDKRRLRANFEYLVQTLRVSDIQDRLYQYGVLTDEDLEEISLDRGITPQTSSRRLIRILQNRGPRAFDCFCKALDEKECGFIADKLRNTDPENVDTTDSSFNSYAVHEKMDQLQKQLWVQTELIMKYKEEIDGLKSQLKGNESETLELRKKFREMEENMTVKGLTEGEVVSYLKDYMDQQLPAESSEPVDEMDSCSGLPRPRSGSEISRFARAPEDTITFTECVARELGKDVVSYVTGSAKQSPANQYAATMRRTVHAVSKTYDKLFLQFLQALKVTELNGYKTLSNVANELFRDGINWGRIVAFYSFGGSIAKYTAENGMPELTPVIGDFLGYYASKHLTAWIEKNGGWDAFNKQFAESSDGDSSTWKPFLLTAIGLGTLVTLVNVVR